MAIAIETYLRRVATTGCGVEELGAAVRICKAGWSAQLDGTPLLDGVDFVKTVVRENPCDACYGE